MIKLVSRRRVVSVDGVEVVVEERFNVLFGVWVRISPRRAGKPIAYAGAGVESAHRCPFCYPNVLTDTPTPRSSRGNAFAFPNRYPFADRHMVAVPNAYRHATSLSDVSMGDFVDAVSLIFDSVGPRAYIGFNYLPHAGASQPHVHLQAVGAGRLATSHAIMNRRCRLFARRGVKIIDELISAEVSGGRLVAERSWGIAVASFAPRLEGEVLVALRDWDADAVGSAMYTIARALDEAYPGWGINAVAYPPTSCLPPLVSVVLRRPGPSSDVAFMELLLGEPIATIVPEEHAETLRRTLITLNL